MDALTDLLTRSGLVALVPLIPLALVLAKTLIDILTIAWAVPGPLKPLLAVGISWGVLLLLALIAALPITWALVAAAFVAAVFAGGGAVGVTELQGQAWAAKVMRKAETLTDEAAG